MSKFTPLFLLLVIVALGAFFRFYAITEIPPGLYPDEAMNGNNALEALATGRFSVFYPENNGREGLFINLQAIPLAIFGNQQWALRLISAIFGTLTIIGVYLLAKELFLVGQAQTQNSKLKTQNDNSKFKILTHERIALFSAFFLTTSYWHLNFSRIGFRAILVPFFTTFAMYFLLKGLRRGNTLDLVAAGIFAGLGFYTYIAFRFMIFVFAVPIGWHLWQWRKTRNKELGIGNYGNTEAAPNSLLLIPDSFSCAPCAILLFIFVAFVVALPLGVYFILHPEDFASRAGGVSIFSAASPLKEFGQSTLSTLGMFFVKGDCNWRHNYACQPQLHPLVGVFFVIGLFAVFRGVESSNDKTQILNQSHGSKLKRFGFWILDLIWHLDLRFWVLSTWLFFLSLPATLTREGLPHALRSIGMIPPVMIIAARGASWSWEKITAWLESQKENWPVYARQIERIRRELAALFLLLLLTIPFASYRAYFLRWASDPRTYFAFSADLLHIGEFLKRTPPDVKKYIVMEGFIQAQTVIFVTDTISAANQSEKNIYYVTPTDWNKKIALESDEKVIIAFLNNSNLTLISAVQNQFPGFRPKAPADFIILQNY